MNSGLRTYNSRVSGLLTLPSNTGVLSTALTNVSVTSSLPSDIVLGLDWFEFVRSSASDSDIQLAGNLNCDPKHFIFIVPAAGAPRRHRRWAITVILLPSILGWT
ncbi:hypothetical protein K438DRAFT_1987542 [Mycena galopus ATCC 62051]|nr:hypothetical protein K438DRAFT_1987542 [Mycena galopus ATCC 62051]